LSQGKLREAWRDYELRRKVLKVASIAQPSGPEWRGENLDGNGILLHSEQGFGDVIQSIRYVPLVRERVRARDCAVSAEPAPVTFAGARNRCISWRG